MKSIVRKMDDHGKKYDALMFVCPGCALDGSTGLHILSVTSSSVTSPSWGWDGNLEAPTLSPSILTGKGTDRICHSFLKAGLFEFLTDSTHAFSGKKIAIPDLPEWVVEDSTRKKEEET